MASMHHHMVTAVFFGADLPSLVGSLYCSDDSIGERTVRKRVHDYAKSHGAMVRIETIGFDRDLGWEVTAIAMMVS